MVQGNTSLVILLFIIIAKIIPLSSAVEEEIDLKLFDTSKLVQEAKKLREAKRIEKEAQSLDKRLTSSGSSSLITANSSDRASGALTKDLKAQSRTGAVTGANFTSAFNVQVAKTKKLEADVKKKLKKFEDRIFGGIDDISGVVQGGPLAILGRFGPIGAIIASAIPGIAALVLDQYNKRGGLFSKFLKVTKQAETVNEIEELTNVRGGVKFLTSDLRIVQGAPNNSNTQNLKYEHVRFVMEDLGH